MRNLGIDRLKDIEELTFSEFNYMRYAFEYKQVDKNMELHKLAFLMRNASATQQKGSGKNAKEEYVYKTFNDFFDYEKKIDELEGIDQKDKMSEGMKKIIYGGE